MHKPVFLSASHDYLLHYQLVDLTIVVVKSLSVENDHSERQQAAYSASHFRTTFFFPPPLLLPPTPFLSDLLLSMSTEPHSEPQMKADLESLVYLEEM